MSEPSPVAPCDHDTLEEAVACENDAAHMAAWARAGDPKAVAGYCPMGCGRTLLLADGGHITCSLDVCPRPTAVDEVLADRETEHIVDLGRTSFAIIHPLRERLDGELLDCDLHAYLTGLDGPPRVTGRYRAVNVGGQWSFDDPAPPASPREEPGDERSTQ